MYPQLNSERRTYKFTVVTSVQIDDVTMSEAKRSIQEQINMMYHQMERDDIRIVLQHKFELTETSTEITTEKETTMPIIEFSDEDLLRGRVVEPAWYVMRIDNVGEAPSKDGGSTNYPVEGVIIKNADTGAEDFAGVPVTWNLNSKFKGGIVGFLSSFGVSVEARKRFELANSIGKMLEVFVDNDTWQGRLKNNVNHKYRPLRGSEE